MLYRYRRINEYTYENLEKDEFYISSADTFNDLFDIQIAYNTSSIYKRFYSDGKIRKAFLEYKHKYNYPSKTEDEQFLGYIDYVCMCFVVNIKRKVLICSLTTDNDNPVMWSHYANDSQGYVLGYNEADIEKMVGTSLDRICIKVTYSETPFDSTDFIIKAIEESLSESDQSFDQGNAYYKFENYMFHGNCDKHFFIRKTEKWGYENEIRFLFYYGSSIGNKHEKIGNVKPAKIIIGQKMSLTDKLKFYYLSASKQIPLFKENISWDINSFGIQIEKFTNDDVQDIMILINDQLKTIPNS